MKEKNRIKLKKGLQGLPEYTPPDDLWKGIADDLDQNPTDHALQSCIAELPSYDPPIQMWEAIESSLNDAKVVSLKQANKKSSYSRWLAAASVAILVGLTAMITWGNNEYNEETTVSISYESKVNFEDKRTEDLADDMIGQVLAEVQSVSHTWEAPETIALRSSLDKIKASIVDFKAAGEKFGMNQRMHEQLTDMYNKRNKIVRTLAAKI